MQNSSSNNDSNIPSTPQYNITDDLRNLLWNLIYNIFKDHIHYPPAGYDHSKWSNKAQKIVNHVWEDFFKLPSQNITHDAKIFLDEDLHQRFNNMTSNQKCKFLEFLSVEFDKYSIPYDFRANVNKILEGKGSDCHFVGNVIVKKVDEIEKKSLENALKTPHIVKKQFQNAIRLMSDQDNPDYRNSIKESISAIEGLAGIILNDAKKNTLSDLLKKNKLNIHPALKKAINNIYGYASETSRHTLTEDNKNVTYSDALFIAVVCSAFVNHIIRKNTETD